MIILVVTTRLMIYIHSSQGAIQDLAQVVISVQEADLGLVAALEEALAVALMVVLGLEVGLAVEAEAEEAV